MTCVHVQSTELKHVVAWENPLHGETLTFSNICSSQNWHIQDKHKPLKTKQKKKPNNNNTISVFFADLPTLKSNNNMT